MNKSNDEPKKEPSSLLPYENLKALAKDFHESGFFASIKNPQQALVTIMAGRELGMGPFEAMSNIYVVQGRPAYYAHKYGDMIKRTGKYNYKVVTLTDTECEIEFTENGKSIGNSKFTMEDARIAKLGGMNWDKYPRNMLYARAITNGARWHCPDAFNGAAYTPEELGAEVSVDEHGTETVINIPADDVVVKDAQPTTSSSEVAYSKVEDIGPAPTEPSDMLEIDTDKSLPGSTVLKAADFEIGGFTERTSAAGNLMGNISIISTFTLPSSVRQIWDEYSIGPKEFESKMEMYRRLQAGDKVLASLIFETKGEKNYQNIEVIMKYPPVSDTPDIDTIAETNIDNRG